MSYRYFKISLSRDLFQRLHKVATESNVSIYVFAEVAVTLAIERAEQFSAQSTAHPKELD